MPRVPDWKKLNEIIYFLAEKGPANINDIADYIARKLNIKFTTSRTATIRIINALMEAKLVDIVGMDRRGAKLYDLTPLCVSRMAGMFTVSSDNFDPRILIIEPIKRYKPDIMPIIEDYITLIKIRDNALRRVLERLGEKKEIDETFLSDALFMGIEWELDRKLSWEDLRDEILGYIDILLENIIEIPESELPYAKRRKRKPRRYIEQYGELVDIIVNAIKEALYKIKTNEVKQRIKEALENIKRELQIEIKTKKKLYEELKGISI